MQFKRPLLAVATTDEELQRITYPKLMSPKIDGVRATVVGGRLLSRTLKPIPNKYTQIMFGRSEYEGLDGELVVGNPWDPHLCDRTRSAVMSHGGYPKITFCVFDKWDCPAPFADRLVAAAGVASPTLGFLLVPHVRVDSYEEVLQIEANYLGLGYEGGMLRKVNGIYKQNRSTLREEILLKVKRFTDGEAIVTDVVPLLRNLNARVLDERGLSKRSSHGANKVEDDLMGALVCRDLESGVSFKLGSGFSEDDRIRIWHRHLHHRDIVGQLVTYKKFLHGEKDKPRHGIFKCFRDRRDR